MSVKGSWSRVRDARKFGREMERIFGRKRKRLTAKSAENAKEKKS